MLLNCENGYLRRSRTYKCVQNVQIIFRKSGLQFIDYQIQQCKEYVYLITIKSLLKIVFFITCFAKEVLNNFCFLSASQQFVILEFKKAVLYDKLFNVITYCSHIIILVFVIILVCVAFQCLIYNFSGHFYVKKIYPLVFPESSC